MCGKVNLSELQKTDINLECCRGYIIYDVRVWDCDNNRTYPSLPREGPTAYQPMECDGKHYYVDWRIKDFYYCCGSIPFDYRYEFCYRVSQRHFHILV